ncbi:MAG: hypothetical protein PF904_10695 [Kiritimatiellae bacterium]|jgi:hypothetical protein|nr:hypothetical protein [Kiritimatiellia bacterium]
MKTEDDIISTELTEKALRRAAKGVLGEAVQKERKIPLWDGSKVVWKVPREELADLCAKDECEPYTTEK